MKPAEIRNLQAQLIALHAQAQTLAQQCVAISSQAEACLHLLESAMPAEQEVTTADGVCQHPVEKRRDASTFTLKRFRCGVCGETVGD